ncbi:unnamed protein product [Phaedon cochleariae]|uniref:Uncharacterized protein n=1 Tax=Phaedon cochleariae TaxID=80249 RepID=A0A9P0GWG8_PHACE|nr:unnamed protein product [Phaedon cochleariae]
MYLEVIVITFVIWGLRTDSNSREICPNSVRDNLHLQECENKQCVQTCCVEEEIEQEKNCANLSYMLTDFLDLNISLTHLINSETTRECNETIWISHEAIDSIKEDDLNVIQSLQLPLNYTQFCIDVSLTNDSMGLFVCIFRNDSEKSSVALEENNSTDISFDALENFCRGKKCVRKCCGLEQFVLDTTCAETMPIYNFSFYLSDHNFSDETHLLIHRELYCYNDSLKIKIDDFNINFNGSIYWRTGSSSIEIDNYCLDIFTGGIEMEYEEGEFVVAALICLGYESEIIIDDKIRITGRTQHSDILINN